MAYELQTPAVLVQFDKPRATIIPVGVRSEIGEHINGNGHHITPLEDTSDIEFIIRMDIHQSQVELAYRKGPWLNLKWIETAQGC